MARCYGYSNYKGLVNTKVSPNKFKWTTDHAKGFFFGCTVKKVFFSFSSATIKNPKEHWSGVSHSSGTLCGEKTLLENLSVGSSYVRSYGSLNIVSYFPDNEHHGLSQCDFLCI